MGKYTKNAIAEDVAKMIRRRRWMSHLYRLIWLVAGVLLLNVVGVLFALLLMFLLGGRFYSATTFWWIYSATVGLGLIGACFVKESLFARAARENPISGSEMEIPYPRWGHMVRRDSDSGEAMMGFVADVALMPGGWIVSAISEYGFIIRQGRLNVPLATELVTRLLAEDQGISLASLKRPSDAMDKLVATVAHLRLLEIVDRSDKRDRVWLTSRARDQLVNAMQDG